MSVIEQLKQLVERLQNDELVIPEGNSGELLEMYIFKLQKLLKK